MSRQVIANIGSASGTEYNNVTTGFDGSILFSNQGGPGWNLGVFTQQVGAYWEEHFKPPAGLKVSNPIYSFVQTGNTTGHFVCTYTELGTPIDAPSGGVGGSFADSPGSDGPDGDPTSDPPAPRAPLPACASSQVVLMLVGLPVTTRKRETIGSMGAALYVPGCNGMQAPVRVYQLLYPDNASHTGLDYSAPPTRLLIFDHAAPGNWASDGDGLPSVNAFATFEVVPGDVPGYRTPPRCTYGGGCGVVGLTLTYTPQPSPGLLRSPVRVQLSEDSSGLFQDNRVQIDYVEQNSLELHTPYRIGTETTPARGVTAFEFVSSSLDRSSGLVTYTGQTLLGRLANEYPFPGGYFPQPPASGYTPGKALEALLRAMRGPDNAPIRDWIGWEDLPELYLRGASGPILPTLDQVLIEKPDKPPGQSAQDILKQFFEPFAGYGFRVSCWGRLKVTLPPWHPQADASIRVTQQQVPKGATGQYQVYTDLAHPRVTVSRLTTSATGAVQPGVTESTVDPTPTPTVLPTQDGVPGCSVSFDVSTRQVVVSVDNPDGVNFVLAAVVYDPVARAVDATLTALDLGQGGTEVLDENNVANVATVTSQGYVYQTGNAMQVASLRIGDHYAATEVDVSGAVWPVLENTYIGGPSLDITVNTKSWAMPGFIGGPRELVTPDVTKTLPLTEGASVSFEWFLNYSAFSVGGALLTFRYIGGQVRVSAERVDRGQGPTTYDWIFTLSGAALTFQKSATSLSSTYGETESDISGLSSSRTRYGRRATTLDTGVFQVSLGVLQSMARAIVQDRMYPRAVFTYPLVAPYRLEPEQKYVQIGSTTGTVTAWNYSESHTPQQSQSDMGITFAVLHNLALEPVILPDGSTLVRATERRFGRARYSYAHIKEGP